MTNRITNLELKMLFRQDDMPLTQVEIDTYLAEYQGGDNE